MLAQVLRDECGHSLGLGVVNMACSEDVARVFNEHQRFEVSGSRAEPEDNQKVLKPLTVRRLGHKIEAVSEWS